MIPNYGKCIWSVDPEERHCEFCVVMYCEKRLEEQRVYNEPIYRAEEYILAMGDVLGVDIRTRCRRWEYVWGRNIVAYQLVQDGMHHREVARLLGVERSTIFHCVRSVENMLSYPKSYEKEMEIWRKFQELSYLHKQ